MEVVAAPAVGGAKQVNPWAVALTVTLATFMELLDTSIANVSLPHIAGGLGRSFDETTWVLTSYLVANAVVLPMSAWLSRVFGRKRYYMISVGLFTATSFLCGIAPSLNFLVIFRVLQGIGGGGLAPVEQAILVDTFPATKRAAAFALYSVAIVTAPAIGPPLGGWITDSFSWRWVFFINVPIGLISLFLTNRLVSDPPAFKAEVAEAKRLGRLRIDYIGITLIALGFACLEVVLDRGQIDDWFGSRFISGMFIAAILALGFAIWWELRTPDPVVELALLSERNFAISNVFYFLFGFVLFGSTTMIPELLQSLYGYTATDAGLVLGPGAAVITVLAPMVAILTQKGKVKPRWLIAFSFAVVSASMFYYSSFTLQTDYFHFALARALQGFGYAFLFVPVSVLAYSYLPPAKNNKGSSLTNLFRNWGGSFGVAFITTVHERRTDLNSDRLSRTADSASPLFHARIDALTKSFEHLGFSHANASQHAQGMLYNQLNQQASMLGYMDCFRMMAVFSLIGIPLAFMTRSFRPGGGSAGGH
ncbi:Inner membrane component of tripartite multidrug resistance system [Acidisarcina polymorpha]|uniref:Inner membrane component of tripartite multidrug resistance system n=2 Tax=Acidisarcina polymorpha TaxID=2211140 RepID=A0A2Z5G585_9BACT|nr:DHA2 family efflux MFS transporter permease subunit [Acidisarcina polymorpha]AXC13706.1 Inner membrane component of tripartite multidrug resistance system [Acidisarcina polymorpha]